MKKIITLLCITLFFTLSVQSQKGKESWKKIEALKIAYLTEQLDLTSTEAEKFWPIYNKYSKQQNKLRNTYRKALRNNLKTDKNLDSIHEDEAKELIALKLNTDKQLYESQKKFTDQIVSIIPYKKIIKLQVAELEFGRKLMRKYRRKKPETKE